MPPAYREPRSELAKDDHNTVQCNSRLTRETETPCDDADLLVSELWTSTFRLLKVQGQR